MFLHICFKKFVFNIAKCGVSAMLFDDQLHLLNWLKWATPTWNK